jgi:CheY-like chemotaxis protein
LETFQDVDSSVEIRFVENGEQLLAYLSDTGLDADQRPPHLVLLDLSMPGMDGKQALAAIKTNPRLRLIPVVVLTGSQERHDIAAVYEHAGTSYVAKPVNLDDMARIVSALCQFWFHTCLLPDTD